MSWRAVLGAGVLVACQPTGRTPTQRPELHESSGSATAAEESDPAPRDEPKSARVDRPDEFPPRASGERTLDVTMVNVSRAPCEYTLHTSEGLPEAGAPTAVLDLRETKLSMYEDEKLCLKSKGKFGVCASVDEPGAEILAFGGCSSIAASETGFSAKQRAMAAPHTVGVCCKECRDLECTGCSEPKDGKTCPKEASLAGKCSFVDDVLDCVPAAEVEPDGTVKNPMGPFREMIRK